MREFASVQGEFDAWKLSVLNSGISKMTADGADGKSQDFYEFIRSGAQEERLSDEDFVRLGQDYIRLVLKSQQQPQAGVEGELAKLRERAAELSTGKLNAASATLGVNLKQIEAQELLWFGVLSEKLSKGKRSTIERKQKALIGAEEKAKSDKKIDEREREKLSENANKVVQELMEAIAS